MARGFRGYAAQILQVGSFLHSVSIFSIQASCKRYVSVPTLEQWSLAANCDVGAWFKVSGSGFRV